MREMSRQSAAEAGTTMVVSAVERAALILSGHWLVVLNFFVGVFAGLPLLAPLLTATGYNGLGGFVFQLYSAVCHQLPSRSFFLWGHQMAYCQRNTAIYTSILVGGIAFALVRCKLRRLGFRPYLLLIAPMALDGFTQLFGLRESIWQLRVLTGTLFGLATVWLVYPVLEQGFAAMREALRRERSKPNVLVA